MNRILLANEKIENKEIDDSLEVEINENELLKVKTLKIKVLKDTNLEIKYHSKEETKLDIYININKNVKANIYEIKEGKFKISYRYYLEENSNLNIYKINDTKKIKESIIINLNGENSKINYILKTISKNKEDYNIMVYHNYKNTQSHIINNGVNIKEGNLKFNVSGFVPKGIKSCILDQNNRIINLTKEKCEIKPNLFIDENDVIANHSAHIGKCNDNEMFYLQSRGIKQKDAENLIIQGFLVKGLNTYQETMQKIISKYWR